MSYPCPRLCGSASGQAAAQAVLAMAQRQMGQPDSAKAALASGTELLDNNWISETRDTIDGGDPHDWLIARILLREAKAQLESGK
ncbi:MAG: hypothetical protein ABI680_07430 [Chthoniobacteraceae bacterium]